ELFSLGARTFLVPGKFLTGCYAAYLTKFKTTNMKDYDSLTGCLKWPNEFSEYHNEHLKTELNRLQKLYPSATIKYPNYYEVVLRFYREPTQYGAHPKSFLDYIFSQLCILPRFMKRICSLRRILDAAYQR
ncbi:unnamed protein product, partial [Arabis nemorensis]